MFLDARARARASGDHNLARALTADLARYGIVDTVVPVETAGGLETTAIRAPERAVPQNRGGRPRLPRCEHGKTPGKCRNCPEH